VWGWIQPECQPKRWGLLYLFLFHGSLFSAGQDKPNVEYRSAMSRTSPGLVCLGQDPTAVKCWVSRTCPGLMVCVGHDSTAKCYA
jgi:hypothetical protein